MELDLSGSEELDKDFGDCEDIGSDADQEFNLGNHLPGTNINKKNVFDNFNNGEGGVNGGLGDFGQPQVSSLRKPELYITPEIL